MKLIKNRNITLNILSNLFLDHPKPLLLLFHFELFPQGVYFLALTQKPTKTNHNANPWNNTSRSFQQTNISYKYNFKGDSEETSDS